MTLKVFKIILLLVVAQFANAQTTVQVIDGQTKTAIPNVEIFNSTTQSHYETNISGSVVVNEPTPANYFIFFAEGYGMLEQEVQLQPNQTIVIELKESTVELDAVTVRAKEELQNRIRRLKDVEGTEIYAGKKNEVVQVQNLVANKVTNNARQIYAQVVGLNIYEDNSGGVQLNIGGRGLDPNRSAHFNTRQNGYDISADVLGYPESYYTPPAEALQEIQVIRGAASLQYGSQLGGLVNFKLIEPQAGKFNGKISASGASNETFSGYLQFDGTLNKTEYLAYFQNKTGNASRPNSNYDLLNGFAKVKHHFSDQTSLNVELTHMKSLAKQPGGVTDVQFAQDPLFSNRERNWFEVNWNLLNTRLEHNFNKNNAKLSLAVNGLKAERNSIGFRDNRVSLPDNAEYYRDVIKGEFKNLSSELRYVQDYTVANKKVTGLVGAKFYTAKNKAEQGVGTQADDSDFTIVDVKTELTSPSSFEYPNNNLALFTEQVIYLGDKVSVTPGLRYEKIKTESAGSYSTYNFDLAGNVINEQTLDDNRTFNRDFLIYGLGVSYKPNNEQELYTNFSRNYRSVTFNDIRITNPNFEIDPNITDETGYNVDLGYRGTVGDQLNFDVGVFGLSYDNKIDEIFTRNSLNQVIRKRGNIGKAFTYGAETFGEWNVVNTFLPEKENLYGSLFVNLAVMNSEYTESEDAGVKGNEVPNTPRTNLKTGLRFGVENLLGNFQFTHLAKQYTDATNAEQNVKDNQSGVVGAIPAYQVADVSLSYKLGSVKLEAGSNNLFNESYFTRRATGYPGPGIIPSDQRTFYGAVTYKF